MESKIKGRDINGMRSVGWSQPNLAAIQSIKVKPKCSNAELLEAVKQIVCQSVIALRGTNADDKYRNIVDMLMLRIRGELAKTIKELKENASSIDTSEIVEDVKTSVSSLIEDKLSKDSKQSAANSTSTKELADAVISAVSSKVQQQKEDTTKSSETIVEKTIIEKTVEKTQAPAENAKVETATVQTSRKADVIQSISLDDINSLQTELEKNFKKIESLIQQTSASKTKQAEAAASVQKVETTITQNIVVTQKSADDSSKKLEQKTAPAPKAKAKVEKSGKKAKDVLSGKQFVELLKMLTKCQIQTTKLIGTSIEATNKKFESLNEQLVKIYDHLNKSKISWVAILAGISLFLLPLFWNKIVGFFKWIDEKFDISGIIGNFISSIDWGKYVSTVTGFIWDAIKKKFDDFIKNPMSWVVEKFTTAYTAITEWTKDIWEWVKGKLSWTKKKQDENEAKAESESTQKFQAAMNNLEEHTNANVQQVQESTNEACEQTKANVTESSQSIHDQVDEMQTNANEQITATTQAVQDNADNINNTVLPGMSAEMEKSVDSAGSKVESRADTAITASEAKLDNAVNELDKKIEENGAPTSVSKETLMKMDAEGEGASVGSGGIDQKVEGPKTVVQTTTEEQGKTIQLYAKKDDVDRAVKDNEEVKNLVGNISSGPNITNVNVGGSTTKANIQNKILVNGMANPAEKEAKTYEDMHVTVNEVSKNSATIEDGLNKNQKLLGSLKEKVNDYFGELNGLVKILKDKPPAQHNNNTVVISNNDNKVNNSAQMDDF